MPAKRLNKLRNKKMWHTEHRSPKWDSRKPMTFAVQQTWKAIVQTEAGERSWGQEGNGMDIFWYV